MRWLDKPQWLLVLLTLAQLAAVVNCSSGRKSHNGRPAESRRAGRQHTETDSHHWKNRRRIDDTDEVERVARNSSEMTTELASQDEAGIEPCHVARMKCAFRTGCGMALQNYMVGCSDVMTGSSQKCSDHCRNSLIALTSTEEGQALMKCKCGDTFCLDAKRRIDICRTAVLRATNNSTTVSCNVAQWICMADPLCSTALDFYNRLCRSMFAGKKCTHRCNNSISILRRQEKAAKLSSCVCDGSEDYDCQSIRDNMDRLCFHKSPATSTEKPAAGGGTGAGVDVFGINPPRGMEEEGGEIESAPTHPHHPRPRPPLDTPEIESNQVEIIRSTSIHRNDARMMNDSSFLIIVSLQFLFHFKCWIFS